ncbi:MAG TPA: hypothetical protein VJU61_09245, partial [Polyangiaceae bacterium]|nr:hypothetical protein [Polyangiaceae bacterium]
ELADCVSPLSGSCVASCLREMAACDQPERDCEAECETPTPGCGAQDRALYECRLAAPVDCGESEGADSMCLEEALQLLACAGYTGMESESTP